MLTYIWAEDENHGIGFNNSLPWHLPADLQHFKNLTMGYPMLMGRKTFDSLPKMLPGRQHLVLTHDQNFMQKYEKNNQVKVFLSFDELSRYLAKNKDQDFMVIGGRSLFELFQDQVDVLEVTKIHHIFRADTFMPKINYENFNLVQKVENKADSSNHWDYDFLTFKRK